MSVLVVYNVHVGRRLSLNVYILNKLFFSCTEVALFKSPVMDSWDSKHTVKTQQGAGGGGGGGGWEGAPT